MSENPQHEASMQEFQGGKPITARALPLLPDFFNHEGLITALESAREMDAKKLINMVNYLHFMEGEIYVLLTHIRFNKKIMVPVSPEPCLGEVLVFTWKEDYSNFNMDDYQIPYLIIIDSQAIVLIPAVGIQRSPKGMTLIIPEKAFTLNMRQTSRFNCVDTQADLMQSGFMARGDLVDFSPTAFRIRVRAENSSSFIWLNPEAPVSIYLKNNGNLLFSGACQCLRHNEGLEEREIVLKPIDNQIRRYQPKTHRSTRRQINPQPTIVFVHPFTRKTVQREISDISHSGFSVREDTGGAVLLPGMIIPDLSIAYAGYFRMSCRAQVIYRREEHGKALCGLAILDMDMDKYTILSHIIGYASNTNTYVSRQVDMESLWEFLFDTGFIYPKKYRILHQHRAGFRETYRKLYQECANISCHFTYEKEGRVYAHASMLRAYDRAWLVHHLAARPMAEKHTGFLMVKHVIDYLGGLSRLPSANMEYLMFYFRPDNKFMYGIFGETAKSYNHPRHCSSDIFAYIPSMSLVPDTVLPQGWMLRETSAADLWQTELFYNHHAGGLLFDALDLKGQHTDPVIKDYLQQGFKRDIRVFSLLYENKVKALLLVDQSDFGINLSELLNCIKVIVNDSDSLPWDILSRALGIALSSYPDHEIPVLIYPSAYADAWQIPYEKHYLLWILAVQHSKGYVDFLREKFGINIRD